MLGLLSRFASNFQSAVEGRGFSSSPPDSVETFELYGGARINFIFTEIFGKSLMRIDPFDSLTDEEIRTAICNANGTRPALFVPEISFDLLVKRQIARLPEVRGQPGLQCVDLVFDELIRMASQCETTELTRFPELRDRVVDVVNHMLRKCVGPTQSMISNLINIELAYINTSHPDFIGGSRAVAQLMEKMAHESAKGQGAGGAVGGLGGADGTGLAGTSRGGGGPAAWRARSLRVRRRVAGHVGNGGRSSRAATGPPLGGGWKTPWARRGQRGLGGGRGGGEREWGQGRGHHVVIFGPARAGAGRRRTGVSVAAAGGTPGLRGGSGRRW